MQKISLIIAGGRGTRMGSETPKQFLEILGKPIIIRTLECFESMQDIDTLAVVCVDGWQDELRRQAEKHRITKLRHIVKGGKVGQESILHGIQELAAHYAADSIVLIHDAIRPLVSHRLIRDCIESVKLRGFSAAVLPCNEAMLKVGPDGTSSCEAYPREQLRRTQTPQGGRLGRLMELHRQAALRGITDSVATCTLCAELGENVHFCEGSFRNIKITTQEDLILLRALLREEIS